MEGPGLESGRQVQVFREGGWQQTRILLTSGFPLGHQRLGHIVRTKGFDSRKPLPIYAKYPGDGEGCSIIHLHTQWPSVGQQHLEMLIAMDLKAFFFYGSDVTYAHIALAKASHMFTAYLKDGKSDSILYPKGGWG